MPATATSPADSTADATTDPTTRSSSSAPASPGIGAAIKLKEAGIEDFVVIDKADSVAGTWRENTYPGCACDVPSHMYSFSFEQNPDWSEMYAPQQEIRDYLEHVHRQVRRPAALCVRLHARSARPGTRRPASGAASARARTARRS